MCHVTQAAYAQVARDKHVQGQETMHAVELAATLAAFLSGAPRLPAAPASAPIPSTPTPQRASPPQFEERGRA